MTEAGRQVAVSDQAFDLTAAIELVRILDAIDLAVDELEEESPPEASPIRSAPVA